MGESQQTFTWSFPICPNEIRVAISVLRALQHESSITSETRQGLLFGEARPGVVDVSGVKPVAAFEEAQFTAALESATQPVIGYYRIRDGGAFILAPEELQLATTHFRNPAAVTLLIERRATGPAEGTFFFWRGDSFVHNLPVPFPIDTAILPPDAPAPPPPGKVPFRIGPIGAIAAVVLASIAGAEFARKAQPPQPEPPASEAAAVRTPQSPHADLRISWDPQAAASAITGLLIIDDGGAKRGMTLTADTLRHGSVVYTPQTDQVTLEMKTQQADGSIAEMPASARPDIPAPPPTMVAAVTPRRSDPPKPVEPPRIQMAERRAPLKRFQLVAAFDASPRMPAAVEPPPVLNAPSMAAALPIIPGINAAAAPVHSPHKSGRVIWTGTLLRRGVVELEGPAVSAGSVSGALPGVPIALTVSPAEFSDDGLVVYTADPARNNRVEPPSVGNGWNKLKFVLDPERVKQLAVLETPNASNRFNHLAVRNDSRRCSMILIDWTTR